MTNREHERAIDLISQSGVEGLNGSDSNWLELHLASCEQCSSYATTLRAAAQAMRAMPVMASPSLVRATQVRLRARVLELQERQSRSFLIGVSFCLGVLSSTLSAWLWWKFGGLVAERLHLPPSIIQPGLFVFWMLPALIIAIAMLASSHPVIDRTVTLALLGEREGDQR